ncbi:MAG: FxLYD domain-containing protein [Thermomicrobiales bacterium]
MRKLVLIAWLSLLYVVHPQPVAAQSVGTDCVIADSEVSACREFTATAGNADDTVWFYQFLVVSTQSESNASTFMQAAAEALKDGGSLSELQTVYDFGEEQIVLSRGEKESTDISSGGVVIYRIGPTVAIWVTAGEGIFPITELHDVYDSMNDVRRTGSNPSAMVVNNLPTLEYLPAGYELTNENYSSEFDSSALTTTKSAASEKTPTNDQLMATIAALETQAAKPDVEPTRVSRTPTEEPVTSSSGPLEIGSITTKDAGIGDGSLYAYVEVTNVSGKTLSYVGVDATCRDSSGRVVATGIGNSLNLAPGDSTVLTVIFLSSSTCERVEVKTSPLTGAF